MLCKIWREIKDSVLLLALIIDDTKAAILHLARRHLHVIGLLTPIEKLSSWLTGTVFQDENRSLYHQVTHENACIPKPTCKVIHAHRCTMHACTWFSPPNIHGMWKA